MLIPCCKILSPWTEFHGTPFISFKSSLHISAVIIMSALIAIIFPSFFQIQIAVSTRDTPSRVLTPVAFPHSN